MGNVLWFGRKLQCIAKQHFIEHTQIYQPHKSTWSMAPNQNIPLPWPTMYVEAITLYWAISLKQPVNWINHCHLILFYVCVALWRMDQHLFRRLHMSSLSASLPFCEGIHWSTEVTLTLGRYREALVFSLMYAWTTGWKTVALLWFERLMWCHCKRFMDDSHPQTSNISYTCRRCSNYIFILDLTPGFIGLSKDNCKTEREYFGIRCGLHQR